jgi:hypothetical protein
MPNALEGTCGARARALLMALICCCSGLAGCTADVAKALGQEPQWTVTAYDGGRVKASRTVGRDSAEGAELLKWANANPDGWSFALQDYVPELLVSSPSFRLNLQATLVVFGTGRLQYSKRLSAEDSRRLRQVLTAESPSR